MRSKRCTIWIFYLKRYGRLIERLAVFATATPVLPTCSGGTTKTLLLGFLVLGLGRGESFCRIGIIGVAFLAFFVVLGFFLAGAFLAGSFAVARSFANWS